VAHDFNNLLMGIMNYVELCRDGLSPEHPVRAYLDEIDHDAQQSADITRQLLAFARKQLVAPEILDLNQVTEGLLMMLRRLLGADIDLVWLPGANLWPVRLDAGQLSQVLASLCTNARDAIVGVGKVSLETRNLTLDPAYAAAHPGVAPGDYVQVVVSDSGCGMSKEVLARIFEPFFTTKEMGRGTGLGLATVHGIIEQNHGHVEVRSEPGQGTTFQLHLPRVRVPAATPTVAGSPAELARGTETILVAEDEKSVRLTTQRFLERVGYTVLAAATPAEALNLVGGHAGPIDLLITDVVMPGMNGSDLARRISAGQPRLKCLFMSGYTASVAQERGGLDEGTPFLAKPFAREDLLRKVRAVLDG
jgi:CheY-like chemotaxis protein